MPIDEVKIGVAHVLDAAVFLVAEGARLPAEVAGPQMGEERLLVVPHEAQVPLAGRVRNACHTTEILAELCGSRKY